MDILSGLSAVSQAVGLVTELKDIDRGVDEAGFKLKIAELVSALADTKIASADAREGMADKDREIRDLHRQISEKAAGPICPICNTVSFDTVDVRPDPILGEAGYRQHTLKCNNESCGHKQTRKVDPNKFG